jgi:hypothetical protein
MSEGNVIQAYRQAPWRKQLQVIGLFSLALVFAALVAGIYLNVTARGATIGRRIQIMQEDILESRQRIADMETQLALMTSSSEMEKRAEALGFRPTGPDDLIYIEVEGYPGRSPVVMAPPPGPITATSQDLPPEFTQSLIDWVRKLSLQTPVILSGIRP